MLSTLRATARSALPRHVRRRAAATAAQKREGDISDAFASMSGLQFEPLADRYADLKARLVSGHEDAVRDSWERLLRNLRDELPIIAGLGSNVIPQIDFKDIGNAPEDFKKEYRKRGVAVVRGVVPEQEALQYKHDIREYVRRNPHTKAFPPNNPQVYELYWSPSQIRARSHPNLLAAQRFLLSFWHSANPSAPISSTHPTIYADRLRIRQPGDAQFALGPHIDGGSVERWEEEGYGRGKVYDNVWRGEWEAYDPWESSCRIPVVSDRYQGAGACSMFRMAQGWLSMSETGPGEGTLLVNPLLRGATAYFLLRPFFSAKRGVEDVGEEGFLREGNWRMDERMTSWLQGATPGHGQELRQGLHPHLELGRSMVHVPRVRPGDYVVWHCDSIHAVDQVHAGQSDSSVLYIPACPLTELNAQYLVRQRQAFLEGIPGPDFPGGRGEADHNGRPTREDFERVSGDEGLRAFGLKFWNVDEEGLLEGEREVMRRANELLGFA